ncbi:MAG: hypothetical protein JW751_00610 [Polyangiaceae bacterium]|nr:hypothetical protein [Polyangiaceae bacterium]
MEAPSSANVGGGRVPATMADALDTARSVGSAVAMATNAAILLTAPDRYGLWVDHVGVEVARMRIVDTLSRLSGWLRRLLSDEVRLGQAWLVLEEPTIAILRDVVEWNGMPPIPGPLMSAAESALPLFGVRAQNHGSFDLTEAPTLPLLQGTLDPLTALDDDQLSDDRSELRFVVHRLVERSRWRDALLAFRGGDTVLRATDSPPSVPPTAPALDLADTTPRVADILDRTDLCLFLDLGKEPMAIRLSGARLLLVAAATSPAYLQSIRDPMLGTALNRLLQTLEDRVERTSAPPWSSDPSSLRRWTL